MNNIPDEVIDAAFELVELPALDNLGDFIWKTKERDLIRVRDMDDKHLRNCALFLTGFGFQKCIVSEPIRIAWLLVFSKEWERRMYKRQFGLRWIVKAND